MKNSAWYHKLWRKKLDTLSVPDEAGAAWAGMKTLLDKNMPAGSGSGLGHPVKSLGSKLVTWLTYILPAAAMIGGALYFLQLKNKKDQPKPKPKIQVIKLRDSVSIADSLAKDSLFKSIPDTAKSLNDTSNIKTSDLPVDTTVPNHPLSIRPKVGQAPVSAAYHHPISLTKNMQKGGGSKVVIPASLSLTTQANQTVANPTAQTTTDNSTQNASKSASQNTDAGIAGTNIKQNASPVSNSDYGKPGTRIEKGTPVNTDKQKGKIIKSKKLKNKQTVDIITPPYNYGLELGLNTGSKSTTYFGVFGTYALNKRWLVNAGLRINSPRQLSGEYTHASYFSDTSARFKITDTRKILVLDVPFTVEYKASNLISIKAGPVISFAVRQSNKSSNVTVNRLQDTLYHKKQITADIANTTVNTVNIGFNGGVSFHLKQFDINGQYQVLTPYKIKSNLGSYSNTYHTFQIGVGYRFK